MKNFDLHEIYWQLGQYAKKLGMLGLLGILLLVACGLVFLSTILPEKTQLIQANQMLVHAQASKVDTTQEILEPEVSEKSKSEDVVEFYRLFPAGETLPKKLELIEKTALKQQLKLNQGEYKLSKSKQGELMRYEIVFPLVGSYAQIRQFVADVLQKLPALALSDLQIKRENVASPTVQARLVFTLFLQGDSWQK